MSSLDITSSFLELLLVDYYKVSKTTPAHLFKLENVTLLMSPFISSEQPEDACTVPVTTTTKCPFIKDVSCVCMHVVMCLQRRAIQYFSRTAICSNIMTKQINIKQTNNKTLNINNKNPSKN